MNYYNEFDPNAAAWLRELIAQGHLPPGHVDTRSITEVQSHELTNYTQCHFFAGIGGWPYALKLANWPTDRPVWTGSCPCQPFSAAGQRKGTADERHLWPHFFRLIEACRPPVIFGEQVASTEVVGHKGEGQRVSDQIPEAAPSQGSDSACRASGEASRFGFRLATAHGSHSGEDQPGLLRGDGSTAQLGWRAHLGQSLSGQDCPGCGLPLFEHPDRLPCDQWSNGRLGGAESRRYGVGHLSEKAREVRRAVDALGREFAAQAGGAWLDLIQADLEASGYAFGSCVLAAASLGAPHIRQRLYWVANSGRQGLERCDTGTMGNQCATVERGCGTDGLADSSGAGFPEQQRQRNECERSSEILGARRLAKPEHSIGRPIHESGTDGRNREDFRRQEAHGQFGACGEVRGMADTAAVGFEWRRAGVEGDGGDPSREQSERLCDDRGVGDAPGDGRDQRGAESDGGRVASGCGDGGVGDSDCSGSEPRISASPADGHGDSAVSDGGFGWTSPLDGQWRDADWLLCRDGKWRPVEPAFEQMAHGISVALVCLRNLGASEQEKQKVIYAASSNPRSQEILRALQHGASPESVWLSLGGQISFLEATLLFACLLEHSGQLGGIIDSQASGIEAVRQSVVRALRQDWATACPSQGSELQQQSRQQFADVVSALPQTPALELLRTLNGFPLAHKSGARVGRLRGYGNAIVPQVAAEFVQAFLET